MLLPFSETVRLMGGELSNEGRVEVYKFGFWHKMCGIYLFFNYNSNVSNVVCRSLGMNSPNTKTMIGFQGNPFPIHFLKAYYCVGTETSLEECNHTAIDLPYKCENDSLYQLSVVCGQPPGNSSFFYHFDSYTYPTSYYLSWRYSFSVHDQSTTISKVRSIVALKLKEIGGL